jgi:hypothetical protein
MHALEILLLTFVASAGILVTTFTTIFCVVRHAQENWDRQLFHAYLLRPHEVEAWLAQGALTQVQEFLSE